MPKVEPRHHSHRVDPIFPTYNYSLTSKYLTVTFIQSLNKYLLSVNYVLDVVLEIKNTNMYPLIELKVCGGKEEEQIKIT